VPPDPALQSDCAVESYPTSPRERTRWVEALRLQVPGKSQLDPLVPYAFMAEAEADGGGGKIPTATIFLTNRECPYRCLMCDLWRNTLDDRVPRGAIAGQIRHALARLPEFAGATAEFLARSQIKLYNAGSFFDPSAIPQEDYAEIAAAVAGFGRVVVECHPALVGQRTLRFQRLLAPRLEVAIGLETASPEALGRLNKRFTVEDFRTAAGRLQAAGIDLRVFLLLRPPFVAEGEGAAWLRRSIDLAFDCGGSTCCIIPLRHGNGAIERIAASGGLPPQRLRDLETAVEYGLGLRRGRVLADLWDIEQFYSCDCSPARAARLVEMNRVQRIKSPILCDRCRS